MADYHETGLSQETTEIHRGIASLIEELDAVDWYQQRIDVTQDDDLKQILIHNRDEEMEHAAMALEWLRRKLPKLDAELKKYLFTAGPIGHGDESSNEPSVEQKLSSSNDLGISKFKKGVKYGFNPQA